MARYAVRNVIRLATRLGRHCVDPQLPGQVCRVYPRATPRSRGFPADLLKVARRKLVQLNGAEALDDLAIPPGNMSEALKGDLRGKHSIRINDQWRAVFRWTDSGPEDVEISDYH
jgi:proteic killer suppression protein